MARMQRIEVLMSTKLRKSIDECRAVSGESISGYMRRVLYAHILSTKQQKST